MKKGLLFLSVFLLALAVTAQKLVTVPPVLSQKVSNHNLMHVDENTNPLATITTEAPSIAFPEDLIGGTIYDLQSNGSSPYGRLIMFDDGTFGGVWTRGTGPTSYTDRGTGYNYFDGTAWGPEPTSRVETMRTGWPSLCQMGVNGEIVISHKASVGLAVERRNTKGTGSWTESAINAPAGAYGLLWPRAVSSGTDHMNIHLLAVTTPVANGGTIYQGMDPALLYYRSTDGGATWDDGRILDGMTSTEYATIGGDNYAWAEPQGNNLAFVVCDPQDDMFIMKSTDNGDTWTKTIVWEQPYPHLNNGVATDTLWSPDAAASLAFDKTGKLHLAFGTYRIIFSTTGYSFWPGLSGITYWNEDLPTFTGGDQWHILNIDSLDAQGKQIGYYNIDWNGNGTLDIIDGGGYNEGWASWPQLQFDENNNVILIYSALMENYDNGTQNYRHILSRASSDNAASWGQILDVTDDPIHMFDECVWPVICSKSDAENWYFTYQLDNEPGTALGQDADPPGDNYINFYHLSKILNSTKDLPGVGVAAVSSNYPNPVVGKTTIDVTLSKAVPVSISVAGITGKQLSNMNYGIQTAGVHKLVIDASSFSSGVYLYTVTAGQQKFTRKMIVK